MLSAASSYCLVECPTHWEGFCRTVATALGSKPAGRGLDSSRWLKDKADRMGSLRPMVPMFVQVTPRDSMTHGCSVWLQKMKMLLTIALLLSLALVAVLEAVEAFVVVSASVPECVSAPWRPFAAVRERPFAVAQGQPFAAARGPLSVVAQEIAFVAAASELAAEV